MVLPRLLAGIQYIEVLVLVDQDGGLPFPVLLLCLLLSELTGFAGCDPAALFPSVFERRSPLRLVGSHASVNKSIDLIWVCGLEIPTERRDALHQSVVPVPWLAQGLSVFEFVQVSSSEAGPNEVPPLLSGRRYDLSFGVVDAGGAGTHLCS